jgi:hypothetical protein
MVPVTVPVGTYILGIPRKYIHILNGYQYPLALLFFNQKFVCTNPCCGSDTFCFGSGLQYVMVPDSDPHLDPDRIQIRIRIRI